MYMYVCMSCHSTPPRMQFLFHQHCHPFILTLPNLAPPDMPFMADILTASIFSPEKGAKRENLFCGT